jgi:hypothetical protein
MFVISVTAVLLSSGIGTRLVVGYLSDSGPISDIGDWPACGYNSPINICHDIGANIIELERRTV